MILQKYFEETSPGWVVEDRGAFPDSGTGYFQINLTINGKNKYFF
ncbi:hypothetical protein QNI19_19175 [Cytophagaceae bacterium DM2B3-1]|uniref:Uncharacterized protein n=1 Tax=Xanthocytophaga flava TaxID=3048013 RepID=A0ABT7CQY6_9BACT|nr:hypothetical protein [Xanthocytophaga flavus]MDJ1495069.1 hypothetical protein [Xanthocytophaga flavus]